MFVEQEETYLDKGLPATLQEAVDKYVEGCQKLERGEKYYNIDCDEELLRSEINCAEVDDVISSKQAWYLRKKYFGIQKDVSMFSSMSDNSVSLSY